MKILVVAHPYDPLAHFVGTAFHQCFLSLGHESTLLPNYKSGYEIALVMYAHVIHNFPKDNTYKIVYNWENLVQPRWHRKVRHAINQFNCVWDCSIDNLNVPLAIKRLYCPIGYHQSFELTPAVGQSRAVSFLGYIPPWNKHRKEIIQTIEKEIGTNIWCAHTLKEYIHQFKDSRLSIAEIIHNTQIHLNIHQNPQYPMFESIRVLAFLLSNKRFIVSEKSSDSPLVHRKHYIETDNFVKDIKYYLDHPQECQEIGNCGYSFIKTNYRLKDFVANCLKEIG